MAFSVNTNNTLLINEDSSIQSADEVTAASASWYDSAVSSAIAALGASQKAAETSMFNLSATTSALVFASDSSGTAFSTTTGIDSGLKTDSGQSIYLFALSVTGSQNHVVVGRVGNTSSGAVAFAVALDNQVSSGTITASKIWITQYQAVQHPLSGADIDTLANKLYVSATDQSSTTTNNFTTVASGMNDYVVYSSTSASTQILVTGKDKNANWSGVNTSTDGIGIANQSVDANEMVRLDAITGSSASSGRISTLAYTGHSEGSAMGFQITQVPGGGAINISIKLYDQTSNPQAGTFQTDTSATLVAAVLNNLTVSNGGTVVFQSGSSSRTGLTASVTGGVLTISGLTLHDDINVSSSTHYDRLEVTAAADSANFDMGVFSFTSLAATTATKSEIGSLVQIQDSVPTASATGSASAMTVDEASLGTAATQSLAGAFTITTGADTPASATTYALSVDTSLSTGLTSHGETVLLRMNAGVVEGYRQTSGTTVFTLSVNSSGTVSLTQLLAIDQTSSPNDSVTLANAGAIKLTASTTDADGDSASASLNLADKLTFKDAGPSIAAGNAVSITTSDGDTTPASATASFGTANFGADGAAASGSQTYALALNSSTTTLKSGGGAISLALSNGSIVATRASDNATVFTATVDGTGKVTVTQSKPIDEAANSNTAALNGAFSVVTTVKDYDGDTATASDAVNLTFNDSLPTITAASGALSLTTGDTSLNTPATGSSAFTTSGADVPITVAYTLTATGTSTSLTSHGTAIALSGLGTTTITGKAGTATVFTVSVATDGTVTLNQLAAIDHPGGSGNNLVSLGTISVSATATDFDSDTSSTSRALALNFTDSAPFVSSGGALAIATTDGSSTPGTGTATFNSNYGADGAGTTSYALSVVSATTTLTSGGHAVSLSMSGNNVVATRAGDNAVVFTASVNASTGALSVVQSAPIDHAANSNTTSLNGAFSVVQTVTDYDGDSGTASDAVNLTFNDSLPTVTAASGALSLTTGDASLGTPASAGAGFTTGGADVPVTLAYVLNASSSSTGLTSHGTAITLSGSATGTITGKAGSATVFTVAVASDGTVSLTQSAAIDHVGTGNDTSVSLANLISIAATATDSDSDTASASRALTLNFTDSTPTIASGGAVTTTATTDGSSTAGTGTATFTPVFGADGQASSGATSYALSIVNATTTLTSGGHAVSLGMSGSNVVGTRAGDNAVVFTASVDGSGNVNVVQGAPIDHAANSNTATLNGAFSVVATIKDYDGDTATATDAVNLTFNDSIPTVTPVGTAMQLSTGDAALNTPASAGSGFTVGGADVPVGLAYALNASSTSTGLTSHGTAITLSGSGTGTITGKAGSATVFTVSVASDGTVSLVQSAAIDHPGGGSDDSVSLAGLISVQATATDFDSDTANASRAVTLTFADSLPTIGSGGAVSMTPTTDGSSVAGTGSATFTADFGADGQATSNATTYALAIVNASSGLKSGGSAITLAMSGGNVVGTRASDSAVVFTASVDGSGSVTVTQAKPIDHDVGSDVATLIGAFKVVATITDYDGDSAAASDLVNLTFNDASPTVTAASGTLTVGSGDTTLGTPFSNSAAFTIANGPDAPGTVAYRIDASGSSTGLKSHGVDVTLSGAGTGTVTAKAGDVVVFTVSAGSDGTVTLVQSAPIDHPAGSDSVTVADLFTVAAQATDFDGDSSGWISRSLSLTFSDSKPSIDAGGSVDMTATADGSSTPGTGTASFTPHYGADVEGSTTYALSLSGDGSTSLSSHGHAITVSIDGHGNAVGTRAGDNLVVFTASVDSSGNLNVLQSAPIDHAEGSDVAHLNGALQVDATATDYDGDTAKASDAVNLTFNDGKPTITAGGAVDMSATTDGSSSAGAGTASFTTDYGADGAGTTTYALSLTGDGTTSLSSHSHAITLSMVDGKVVGTRAGDNVVVFTASVDSSGNVSVVQSAPIDHGPDSDVAHLDGAFKVDATITDYDHDTAKASDAVNLTFNDDKPTITAGAAVDMSATTDGSSAAGTGTASFTTAYGADGGGGVGYALSLTGDGSTSLTSHGHAISVGIDAHGNAVGTRAGDNVVVFTASVDSAGNVSVTQSAAIDHDPGSDVAHLNGTFQVDATITDYDGDTAKASDAVNLTFNDDKPTIDAGGAVAMTATTDGSGTPGSGTATFTTAYGADGGGSTTYGLSLTGDGATTLKSHGHTIGLSVVDGKVVGTRAGDNVVVFTASVDSSGNVSVTQSAPIDHAEGSDVAHLNGAFQVDASITDYDHDTVKASDAVNLTFNDDKPTIDAGDAVNMTATTDGSSVPGAGTASFTPHYGADGEGGTTYALSLTGDGATALSSHGHAITLSLADGEVVGMRAGDNVVVFTATVDSSGNVSVTQSAPIDHAVDSDVAHLNGAFQVDATATDYDGDTAKASDAVNLTFNDDKPTIDAGGAVDMTATTDGSSEAGTGTASFTPHYGADGSGGTTYALSLTGDGSTNLTSHGHAITVSIDGHGNAVGTRADDNIVVFTASVDSSGNVSVTQSASIDHAVDSDVAHLNGAFQVDATAADYDGDTAKASDAVNLTFNDDKPTITSDGPVDMTATTDGSSVAGTGKAAFSKDYGADGSGGTAYALSVTGDGSTNLSSHGHAITVSVVDGKVVGTRAGDNVVVFTASVDDSGNVSVTQSAAIDHAAGSDVAHLNGAFQVDATITDYDQDTAHASDAVNLTFNDDAPTISAGGPVNMTATTDGSSTPGAGTATFTSAYGADGAGSTTYGLSLTGDGSTTLKSHGHAISLAVVDGKVVGTRAGDNVTVFTASVDDSGNVSVTQSAAIDHDAGSDVAHLNGAFQVDASITDYDHDTAKASDAVNLTFNDDKPTIDSGGAVAMTATTDGSSKPGTGTATFTPNYGADGAGTLTYALCLAGDGSTSLKSHGQAISLSLTGGNVVGTRAGDNAVVFTASVDVSGNVTVTQSAPIDHASGSDVATLNGAFKVLATVGDYDGDTAKASDAVNLTFNDDKPTIGSGGDVNMSATTDGSSAAGSGDASFSKSYGADGAGSLSYALSIAGTTQLTSGGQAITLSMSGSDVVGTRADNQQVFKVSVNADTGHLTVTQSAPIDHQAGLDVAQLNHAISVDATIGDYDADTARASDLVNLTFNDAGPKVTAATGALSLASGDTTLNTPASAASAFTIDMGPDVGGGVAYRLNASTTSSGLTSHGVAITLSGDGTNTITGKAGNTTVFTVSVGTNGNVTLVQNAAIDQTGAGTAAVQLAGIITVCAKATDFDSDTSAASRAVTLSFADDVPTVSALALTAANNLQLYDAQLNTASGSFAGVFNVNGGADGVASQVYSLGVSSSGASSGLVDVQTKKAVLVKLDSTTGHVIGYTNDTNAYKVFEMWVDGAGNVSAQQFRAIDHTGITSNVATLAAANLVTLTEKVTDGDGDTATATANIGQVLQFNDAAPEFVETTAAGGPAAVDSMLVQYKTGITGSDSYKVDFHNDVLGSPVTIASVDAQSSEGLFSVRNGNHVDFVKSLDPLTGAIYSLDVTDTSYTVKVLNAPKGLPQEIAFDKIPSGSPTETVTAALTGSYGGSVTIDGYIFDPKKTGGSTYALDPKQNGAASTNDDINTNNIGFGIKGGQASQINPYEGFKVQYNPPGANGTLDHLTHLSFDVYGVGNIPYVNINYWLYRNDGSLVDYGTRSTTTHLNLQDQVDATNLLLTDNKAHNIDLFDDGGTTGGVSTAYSGAGDYFDYAVVEFDFPANKTGGVDANQGVRVGTFFTQILQAPEPDSFNFQLQATDGDGDVVLSGVSNVKLDPSALNYMLL